MEVTLGEVYVSPSGEVSTAAPDTSASSEGSWAASHSGDHSHQGVLGGRLNPFSQPMFNVDGALAGNVTAKEQGREVGKGIRKKASMILGMAGTPQELNRERDTKSELYSKMIGVGDDEEDAHHRGVPWAAEVLPSSVSRKLQAQSSTTVRKSSRGNAAGASPPRMLQRTEDQSPTPTGHHAGRQARRRSEDQSPVPRHAGTSALPSSGSRSACLPSHSGGCTPPRSTSPGVLASPGKDKQRRQRSSRGPVQGEIARRGAKISEQLDSLAEQKALLEQSMEESERARVELEHELQEERRRAAAEREKFDKLVARLERLEGTGEANSRLRDDNNLLRNELQGHKLQLQEMRIQLESLQREPPTVVFSAAHDQLCEENAQLRRELKESQVMLIKYTQELSEIHEQSLKQLEAGNEAMLPHGVAAQSTESEPLFTISEQLHRLQPATQSTFNRRVRLSTAAACRPGSRGRVGGATAASRSVSPPSSPSPKLKATSARLVLKGRPQ